MHSALLVLACAAQAVSSLVPNAVQRLSLHRLLLQGVSQRLPQRLPSRRGLRVKMCADGEDVDWREMRARLVRQEKDSSTSSADPSASSSFVYESPLIEQGTILLGGTKMEFGFALRQQFFHKCVMLLLQHDNTFTKGIILNRPSALEVDGWRAWCGHGQVADGGLFVGAEKKMGELEINALHSLTGAAADSVSKRVIKGVSYTSLEGAKKLVAEGVAKKSDFWVCVGYSGWAPGQLQMEVDKRSSWYLAAADSGTLLKELLREARELPPPGDSAITADPGVDTWSNLMRGIGRDADVAQSTGTLADRMLEQWVRAHLLPKTSRPIPATPPPVVTVGTVMCTTVSPTTGLPADRFLLDEQFLHKALLLVLADDGPDGKLIACVLNRPTANVMRFKLPGSPGRRVPYSGDRMFARQLWLHHRPDLGGDEVGDSGVFVLPAEEVMDRLQTERAAASDFIFIGGHVQFSRSEIAGMLAAGEMRRVPPGEQLRRLWPRTWSLMIDNGADVSDGTEVWWLASQCGTGEEIVASVPSDLADEALADWIKFFAVR